MGLGIRHRQSRKRSSTATDPSARVHRCVGSAAQRSAAQREGSAAVQWCSVRFGQVLVRNRCGSFRLASLEARPLERATLRQRSATLRQRSVAHSSAWQHGTMCALRHSPRCKVQWCTSWCACTGPLRTSETRSLGRRVQSQYSVPEYSQQYSVPLPSAQLYGASIPNGLRRIVMAFRTVAPPPLTTVAH